MNAHYRIVGITFLFLLLPGCGDAKSPVEADPAKTTQETVQPIAPKAGEPGTPEATMRQMIKGLRENRPVVIWQAMPEPFQKEINGLVREFARKMDPKLWQQSFTTWEKLARLLRERKTFILNHPELKTLSPAQRQRLEKHWDGLAELLTILVHSEVSNLKQLESFEMGRFLEQTGGTWLKELAELSHSLGQDSLSGMLSGWTPKTLKINGDKATLAWTTEESGEPVSQFFMIRVEGRWVPAGWVSAWEQIRAWRGKLRQMPAEAFARQSVEKIQTLAIAEQTIDRLLATKTQGEFQQRLAQELGEPMVSELAALVRTLSGAASANEDPPTIRDVPAVSHEAGTVMLIVNGAMSNEDEDRIFEALQTALPGDVDVQFEKTPTGRKAIVGPVRDLEQLAKQWPIGTVTKTDREQRTIDIEMKP